jgi:hypothetical protein
MTTPSVAAIDQAAAGAELLAKVRRDLADLDDAAYTIAVVTIIAARPAAGACLITSLLLADRHRTKETP